MNHDYTRIIDANLFLVRIKNSCPTVWQRHPHGHRMLFRVPAPFVDTFPTLQEWELDPTNHVQTVRLDFLSHLAMPPSTPFESAAFYEKYRSATIGGFNRSVCKEIQRFHLVSQLFTRDEALSVLREVDFFKRPSNDSWHEFLAKTDAAPASELSPSVVVPELLDLSESIPVAHLSTESVIQLHDLRHRRYLERQRSRRGNIKLEVFFSKFSFSGNTSQPGHQLAILSPRDANHIIDDSSGFIQALANSTSDDVVDTYVSSLLIYSIILQF